MDYTREYFEEVARRSEYDNVMHNYNVAYYRWVFCPPWETEEAKRALDIWRHKWFSL
jgi:glutamate/tyrosine decarboxylase-like PLP-dependent enzyme